MSIKSMTGHGFGSSAGKGNLVEVEISSVNRRQLDVHANLPRFLNVLEARVLQEVQDAVSRGRIQVEFSLQRTKKMKFGGASEINESVARDYVMELRKLGRALKLKDDISLEALVQLPGVVQTAERRGTPDELWVSIRAALRKALKQLTEMRQAEGLQLAKDLTLRLKSLEKLSGEIGKKAPNVSKEYQKQLQSRLERNGFKALVSDERVAREVAVFADRADITEELIRIASHLKQCHAKMKLREPVGRALDFLAQELGREINTIGSKANNAFISRRVIAFKTELERFREQVQNIE